MSERPVPWSEVISGLFAILTAIATYLGTQPFTTLFALLLGAAVTYSVQNRLQRKSEKRSRNVEYVEKYYGPLLVEIQTIQDKVLAGVSGNYDFQNLGTFKIRPEFYTMGKKLRTDFLSFSDEIEKLVRKINFYRGRINDLICEKGSIYLVNPPGITVTFVSDRSYSPIYLKYAHESDWVVEFLYDCILQDKSPIDIIKEKVTKFQEESLQVEFYLEVRDDIGGHRRESDGRSYSERREILDKIISEVKEELNRDQSYSDFKVELSNLRKRGESISSRLATYIGEYISTVDI